MSTIDRRTFLSVLGAAGATASLAKPNEIAKKIIPYVIPPENIRPGVWASFATTCRECPAGCGMFVRHRDGRIIKPEGNPDHPVSLGGLCPRGQSSPQGLYDPDRVTQPIYISGHGKTEAVSWLKAFSDIYELLKNNSPDIALLTNLQTSSVLEVINQFLSSFDSDRLLLYEPFNYESIRIANKNLFGIDGIPQYKLDQCDFLLSFGADFLETWISPVEFAYQFGNFRSVDSHIPGNFVYIGPRLSMTAANADQMIFVPPGEERWIALAMLKILSDENRISKPVSRIVDLLGGDQVWENITISKEQVIYLAHTFAFAKNALAISTPVATRNSQKAIDLAEAVSLLNFSKNNTMIDFSRLHAFSSTASEEQTNHFFNSISEKDILVIINSNVVFTRPDVIPHLKRAKSVIYLTTLPDETSEIASWVLPIDSPLESWGEYEPYTGIHSLQQPTLKKLYKTQSVGDILLKLTANADFNYLSLLYKRWRQLYEQYGSGQSFQKFWRSVLKTGFLIENNTPVSINLKAADLKPFKRSKRQENEIPLWAWPSIMLYDGSLANRGWMQESPEPVSYVVWGAWADIHPVTAKKFRIGKNSSVKIMSNGNSIELPVRITGQIIQGTVAVMIGQGHYAPLLTTASGIGGNSFLIMGKNGVDIFGTVTIANTFKKAEIVYTSPTYNQYDRGILKTTNLSDLANSKLNQEEIIFPLSIGYTPEKDLYPPHPHRKHRWAMVVDLQKCIGCGACAVACYAENNIPVMGRGPVKNGREMAWLKIVPYAIPQTGSLAWLPMLCQHCDAAPCEPVCPVYASVHNDGGLNAQIYNRCIGTRYCSNNCPYKVRRFNWFNIHWKAPLDMQLNPEVTVRCRGVMEKCTFCVQRIREAEYRAKVEHRKTRDGEILPACVQSCPTRVYTFGDLYDPDARVTRLITCDPRRYQVLKDLNTKPAVIYLKKIIRPS